MRPRRDGPITSGRSGGSDSSSVAGMSSTSTDPEAAGPGERKRTVASSVTTPVAARSRMKSSVPRLAVTGPSGSAKRLEKSEESTQVEREVKAARVLRVVDVGFEPSVHVRAQAQRPGQGLVGEHVDFKERVRGVNADRSLRRLVVVAPPRDRDHVPPRAEPQRLELHQRRDFLVALGGIEL